PEDAERGRVVLVASRAPVEASPRAADVPVGDVLDERVERTDDVDGEPLLVPGCRLRDERVRAGDEPPVERLELALGAALELTPRRRPALDVGVVDEKPDGVPEREQPSSDLVR